VKRARLAGAPIPWRELGAALVVVALVGGLAWVRWAGTPAAGPHRRVPARVTGPAVIPYSKWNRVPATMEVEFADGRRRSVSAPYAQLRWCKIGDTIVVISVPTHAGEPELTIDPGACG
jgi:multidrug efflux pump subunit AcrA (membrane-fusion protein)